MAVGWRIPKFTIDLSLTPQHRYAHVIPYFHNKVDECNLPALFQDVVESLYGRVFGKCLGLVARLAMTRVYSDEETAELEGISKAMKIPMCSLVGLNVLLDVLLGCASGGARIWSKSIDSPGSPLDDSSRIIHFRTLDWGMDELRDLIVELDFVRYHGGPVIAISVTYFGYVGVLTGVRPGLSVSLNFRPYHASTTLKQMMSFRWHQAMVFMGRQQSISSVLRGYLLDPSTVQSGGNTAQYRLQDADMAATLSTLTKSQSTAAYLILCRPDKVYLVEKDYKQAFVRESDSFLVCYNHGAVRDGPRTTGSGNKRLGLPTRHSWHATCVVSFDGKKVTNGGHVGTVQGSRPRHRPA